MRFDSAELTLGWREGLLFLVVLLALYMLFEWWRIRRLRQSRKRGATAVEPTVTPAEMSPEILPSRSESLGKAAPAIPVEAEPPWLGEMLAVRDSLSREVAQMRDELDALRSEFAALREETRSEAAQFKATQTVSPLYTDAMQMAMNGCAPEVIAERCGIARAEAELVIALARNRED